ncbi:MAG: thioesterase family protein [Oscillospiraceae bacterium]|nr:thioesterase family protein [Oscillospiraceae bacterium]
MAIAIGQKATRKIRVTPDLLACNVGSGSVEVFATPMVAALMEGAAADLAQSDLAEGITTVGTQITVEHTAPSVVGMTVTAEATLLETDGRTYTFSLRAWDDAGEIATGSHTRASVKTERFLQKAAQRKQNG